MGLRGPGAKPTQKEIDPRAIRLPGLALEVVSSSIEKAWNRPELSRAERVIAFIEQLPITAGMHAGRRMVLRPWQREIIQKIYATDAEGRRFVRQALITLPRKNGKTALAAGLALAHLVGPEAEQRGQVFSAARDRDQAALIFQELEAVILAVPELAARCNIQNFRKAIRDTRTGSIYQALSSDAGKAHGLSPSFVVCDELAQWPGRTLYDNLVTGTGARLEPLIVTISTSSSDPHHVMSELVNYGEQLRDGVIQDSTFHATIYAAPLDADPWDEKVWHSCNPALADFRSLEEMRAAAVQARRIPAREAAFRNLYLNQAVDPEQRFISSSDWQACAKPVDPERLRGRPCYGGLDLSSTQDMTALALFFPQDGGAVLPWFWLPGDGLAEREDKDRVPYRLWRNQGFLETFPGRAVDKNAVVQRLAEAAAMFDIRGIAYDRWRIKDLLKSLSDEGVELPLKEWGQGYRDMGPAVDEFERLILDAKFAHGGHPVLTWNASNAVVLVDPTGARKLDKAKSRQRIDGLVALVMAVGLAAREPEPVTFDITKAIEFIEI